MYVRLLTSVHTNNKFYMLSLNIIYAMNYYE